MKILLQNNWLRALFLLGAAGICYVLGWWQMVFQVETAAPPRVQAPPPKAPAAHIYFVTFAEVRDFLINPKMSWEDKSNYFCQVLFPGINPKDYAALIKLVAGLAAPSSSDKGKIVQYLFNGLAKDDPAAAWSLIADYQEMNRGDRQNMIGRILGTLAATDLPTALSEFAKLSPADATAARSFMSTLAGIDPQMALRELANLSPADAIAAAGSLFGSWAGKDPAAAAAAVVSLPAGRDRNEAIASIASAWARKDLQAALDWIKSQPPEKSGRFDANNVEYNLYDFTLNWKLWGDAQQAQTPFDEQKALATLGQMTADSLRDETITTVSFQVLRHDPDAQLDWINQTATGAIYYDAINEIFSGFNNPGPMPALLDKVTDPGARAGAIENLANRWDEINSKDALAWAQTLPDSDAAARTTVLSTILTNLSKSDPATATAFVQNSADPAVFLPIAPTLAQNLAVTSPSAALTWTDSLPDGSAKDQALNNVLVTMAGSDFTTAWNDAAALPENAGTDAIVGNLVGVLAQKDPAQASGLIPQLPAGMEQINATNALAAVWVKQDPQAFSVWLTTLPPGDDRDAAIGQLVSSAQATKDPATVAAWINSVTNPQTQAALTQQFNEAQTPK